MPRVLLPLPLGGEGWGEGEPANHLPRNPQRMPVVHSQRPQLQATAQRVLPERCRAGEDTTALAVPTGAGNDLVRHGRRRGGGHTHSLSRRSGLVKHPLLTA